MSFTHDPYPSSDKKTEKPTGQKRLWVWWLAFWGLLIWNFVSLWPRTRSTLDLPYSAFIQQVKQDNIPRVQINDREIDGNFKNPIQWPPQASPSPSEEGATKQAAKSQKPQPKTPKPAQTYKAFRTFFPKDIGDPSLLPLLENHKVEIEIARPSIPWFADVITDGLPLLLLLGLFVWIGRKVARSQSGMFNFARSKARRYEMERPNVTFKDVAGFRSQVLWSTVPQLRSNGTQL